MSDHAADIARARLHIEERGVMPYDEAWALQQTLAAERGAGGPDRLLLLQHPHVFTLGTLGDPSNVLWDEAQRRSLGVDLVRTDRGGDVTYHGPGQVIAYPIIGLPRVPGQLHVHVVDYVRALERSVIAALATFGVQGRALPGMTGVWVGADGAERKIAAIGVRVNVRGITTHGLALNVNTDMRYFGGIIPCGIRDRGVTSLALQLGAPVDEALVRTRLVTALVAGLDALLGGSQDSAST